jgi:hypothetical protein
MTLWHLANQLLVTVNLPVESQGSTGVMKAADDPHIRRRMKNAADRCPRDSRNRVLQRLKNLIRGRVIVLFQDCL